MFKIVLCVCLVAVVYGVPEQGRTARIINGADTNITEFPYLVSLRYQGRHQCGAVILNINTILTAAHCTDGIPAQDFTIRVGSSNVNKGGNLLPVLKKIQHPEYVKEKFYDNDICILRLNNNLHFTKYVQPVTLQSSNDEIPAGTAGEFAGWGYATPGIPAEHLKKVSVTIASEQECAAKFANVIEVSNKTICTNAQQNDVCFKDGGGPLMVDGKAVGILSWDIGCGYQKFDSTYTKISAFYDWIQRNMS